MKAGLSVTPTLKQTAQDCMNKLVNPREKLRLVRNGYKLEFYPDSSIKYSPDISKNNTFMCYFLIQGEAAYPLFSTENDANHPIALTVPKFHFPLIIPKSSGVIMGVKQRSLVARIDNTGDIQTGIKFVLEAVGAVKNPLNHRNQQPITHLD